MGPPPAGGKGPAGPKGDGKGKGTKLTKEELAEQAAKKKAERQAAQAKKAAEEKAHMEFLGKLPELESAGYLAGKVDWSKANRQVFMPGGTTYVRMEDGKMATFRRLGSPATEMLPALLAPVFQLKTVPFRLLHPGNEEYTALEEMTAKTEAYFDDVPMTFDDFIAQLKEAHAGDLPTEEKRPLVAGYEYTEPVMAAKHFDLPAKNQGTVLVQEFLQKRMLTQCFGKLSEEYLRALGRLSVVSALINQVDQMPTPVYKESGGLKHVMRDSTGELLAAELRVHPLAGDELAAHCHRLKVYTSRVLKTGLPEAEEKDPYGYSITEEKNAAETKELLMQAGFEVDDKDMTFFMEGVRALLQGIATSGSLGAIQASLDEAEQQAKDLKAFALEPVTMQDCVNMIKATAAAVCAGAGKQFAD